MELVTGVTLREILMSGPAIEISRSLEIISGVLDALAYSHAHGIVHRDIKPGNVMLTEFGDVKVMDFGIARATDDAGATMTNTWNVVGTAQYLSPEQATGEIADHRSDIYSVGCLFYELLTGQPPFSGDTPVSIAYQHVSGELIKPSLINPELDPNLDRILEVALAKDPASRYQSAQLMLEDVQRVMRGQDVTTKIKRIIPRKNALIMGASAAVFAVLLVLAFVLKPSATGPVYQIPNVVGLTQDQAKELLTDYTINFQHAPDSRIPKDRIASQLPLATSAVQKGSSITLTISDGPGNTTVPINLVGMSLEEARNLLTSAGLIITQTVAVDSSSEPGKVLKVTPDPGAVIAAGSGVVLEIASGNVEVPAVIGTDGIQAQTILVQAGFLVKVINAYDSTQPLGVVLAMAPNAGTTQTIGSQVTITINKQG